jgi:hypothetical protein
MENEFIKFWYDSPFLSFCAIYAIGSAICYIASIPKYICRHLNIRSQGWPPPHLDADGDLKDEDDEE